MTAAVPEARTVELLHCPKCDAAVPLGAGDAIACPHCGATVPIPERYRTLRDSVASDRSERATAEQLYARLGRPPGRVARFLAGTVAATLLFWWLWVVAGAAIVWGAEIVLILIGRHFGLNLGDMLPRWAHAAIYGGVAIVVLGGVALAAARGSRAAAGRRILQALLAARPPEKPGFPALCRQCGAPLAVPPGALGVCCPYCRADNLVALPPAWTAAVDADRGQARRSIVEAEAAERAERHKTFWRSVLLVLAVAGPASGLIVGFVYTGPPPPSWFASVDEQPRPAYGDAYMGRPTEDRIGHADGRPIGVGKYGGAVMIGLRRGEHLRVRAEGASHVTLETQDLSHVPFFSGATIVAKADLQSGQVLEAVAPLSAWYRVSIHGSTDTRDDPAMSLWLGTAPLPAPRAATRRLGPLDDRGPITPTGAPATANTPLAVDQPLEVLQEGKWWRAIVLRANAGGTVRVHYIGWDEEEVVTRDRIRITDAPAPPADPGAITPTGTPATASTPLALDQPLEVLQEGKWWRAIVLRANADGTVRVHYVGWAEEEVVTRDRIRVPAPRGAEGP